MIFYLFIYLLIFILFTYMHIHKFGKITFGAYNFIQFWKVHVYFCDTLLYASNASFEKVSRWNILFTRQIFSNGVILDNGN